MEKTGGYFRLDRTGTHGGRPSRHGIYLVLLFSWGYKKGVVMKHLESHNVLMLGSLMARWVPNACLPYKVQNTEAASAHCRWWNCCEYSSLNGTPAFILRCTNLGYWKEEKWKLGWKTMMTYSPKSLVQTAIRISVLLHGRQVPASPKQKKGVA